MATKLEISDEDMEFVVQRGREIAERFSDKKGLALCGIAVVVDGKVQVFGNSSFSVLVEVFEMAQENAERSHAELN